MSEKMLKNLEELVKSIKNNSDHVKVNFLASTGSEPDRAIVASAAKYHQAIRMLAKE